MHFWTFIHDINRLEMHIVWIHTLDKWKVAYAAQGIHTRTQHSIRTCACTWSLIANACTKRFLYRRAVSMLRGYSHITYCPHKYEMLCYVSSARVAMVFYFCATRVPFDVDENGWQTPTTRRRRRHVQRTCSNPFQRNSAPPWASRRVRGVFAIAVDGGKKLGKAQATAAEQSDGHTHSHTDCDVCRHSAETRTSQVNFE